jgi:ankyrin repeat protein
LAILRNEKETADLLRKHGGKAKTPAISIHEAAKKGNIEAVKQHLADGAGCVDLRGLLLCPQPT